MPFQSLKYGILLVLILSSGLISDISAISDIDYEEYTAVRNRQYCTKSEKSTFQVMFSDTGRELLIESPIHPYIDDTITIDFVWNAPNYKVEVRDKDNTTLFMVISDRSYKFINGRWYHGFDAPSKDIETWISEIIDLIRHPIPPSLPTAWIVGIEPHEDNLRKIIVSSEKSRQLFYLLHGKDGESTIQIPPSYIYYDDNKSVREVWNPKTNNVSGISGKHAYKLYGTNRMWDDFVDINGCHLPTTFNASDPNTSELIMSAQIIYHHINDEAKTKIEIPDRFQLFTTMASHNAKMTYKRFRNRLGI